MIDFACRQFSIWEVIKCSLGLTKSDLSALKIFLDREEWLSSAEISESLASNLTTAQRAVKRLFEKDLIQRRQKNLENGGYVFLYRIKGRADLSDKVLGIISNWTSTVKKELDNL